MDRRELKSRAPLISVVLTTLDRASSLRAALASLRRQTLPRAEFEVVVIDDGSSDETPEVLRSFEPLLPLVHARQANQGIAEARNRGIHLARAALTLFLDDDDVAGESLLEEHLETHRHYSAAEHAVLGYTDLSTAIAGQPLMHFVTEVGCQLFAYPRLQHGQIYDFTHFWGGRSSCKRQLLLERGLFNPVFRFGCEDIELGFRLAQKDFKVVFNRQAQSTMTRSMTLDEFCDRVEKQGRSNYKFFELHPTEAIERWAEVDDLENRWREIAPRYSSAMRSARALDALTRSRIGHGFEPDATLVMLLHRAYEKAFQAARTKGSFDAMKRAASAVR